MDFVCDAPNGTTWFRIETEIEAAQESSLMKHALEKYFAKEKEKAMRSYTPASSIFIEQNIGVKAHLKREMPWFVTLRDAFGAPLVSAMVYPRGGESRAFVPIVVGLRNTDPYPAHSEAIRALGRHLGLSLERGRCYPYARRVG